jgi:hypothetical protein
MLKFVPPAILVRRDSAGFAKQTIWQPEVGRDDGVLRHCATIKDTRISVEHRPDPRSRFALFDNWWLYLSSPVGWDVYAELEELVNRAPECGPERILDRVQHLRLTAFVVCDERTGTLHFGRSLDGLCSMYFGSNGSELIISDSRVTVAGRYGTVRLSADDERDWRRRLMIGPERSFFEQTVRCFAGVRYTIAGGLSGMAVKRTWLAPDRDCASPREARRLFQDDLMHMFSGYGNKRIALRLSGGLDSRTLLVALMQAVREGLLRKEQILCISVLFPELECDESHIIRRVIAYAGFEWHGIAATPDLARQAYLHSLMLPAPPFPTSFMRVLSFQAAKQYGADAVISGHGGDELFDYSLEDILLAPFGKRLRQLGKIYGVRRGRGVVGAIKALAIACVGRRKDLTTDKLLKSCGLDDSFTRVHRAHRRMNMASSSSYEVATWDGAGFGLLVDAPLLRSALWSRYTPLEDELSDGANLKPLARWYIAQNAPEVARVPSSKVSFNCAVTLQFDPSPGEEALDGITGVNEFFKAKTYPTWATQYE